MMRRWLHKPHLAVTATVCVCILLFSPSTDLPDDTPPWINDKVAHGMVFAGLSFLWMQYLQKQNRVLGLLVAFAFLTEIIQYVLPASFLRSFDVKDIAADLTGVLAGWVMSWIFDRVTSGKNV